MISALTKEEFIKAAWEVVGCKVEKSLVLSDIYETAKVSAGLPVLPDSDAIRMFRMMLAEGRSLIRQRNAIEDRAVELLAERPDYQLLRTIPGIGPINALTILAETGDLRRFHHHRQFLKFCGIGPAPVSFRSGAHVMRPFVRRPRGISSRGLSVCGAGCRSR